MFRKSNASMFNVDIDFNQYYYSYWNNSFPKTFRAFRFCSFRLMIVQRTELQCNSTSFDLIQWRYKQIHCCLIATRKTSLFTATLLCSHQEEYFWLHPMIYSKYTRPSEWTELVVINFNTGMHPQEFSIQFTFYCSPVAFESHHSVHFMDYCGNGSELHFLGVIDKSWSRFSPSLWNFQIFVCVYQNVEGTCNK